MTEGLSGLPLRLLGGEGWGEVGLYRMSPPVPIRP
jgi:hypothetical protein